MDNYNISNDSWQCTSCSRVLPLTPNYFYKDKRRKRGLKYKCIECEGGEFRDLPKDGHKKCGTCKIEKKRNEENFYIDSSGENRFYSICKECVRVKSNKNYYRRHEYYKELGRIYNKENKGKINKYYKEYYSKNKIRVKKSQDKYRKNNPHIFEGATIRRKTRLMGLPYRFSHSEWEDCKNEFDNSCAYCNVKTEKLERDHFIALTSGGEFTRNNVIPSCKPCNASKGNKDFYEWYKDSELYSDENVKKIQRYLNYENDIQQLTLF